MGHGRRMPPGWQAFRRMILDRDGWRCVDCSRASRLEASHTLSVKTHPHLELDPDNVKARCYPCHQAFDRKPVSPQTLAWRALVLDILK